MGIVLYYLAVSPPSRQVAMTLKTLGVDYETKLIDLSKNDHKAEEYLKINPRGKIPSIKDGDFVLAESRAISTYLCNQYEKGDESSRLYPTDPKTRGLVDQMLYVSEATYDAISSYLNFFRVLFHGENLNKDKIDVVYKTLDLYEGYLKTDFMVGDHLTLADFCMASSLLLLDLVDYDDFKNYPKTDAWLKKIKNLPYFDECNKEGMTIFREAYQAAIKKFQN